MSFAAFIICIVIAAAPLFGCEYNTAEKLWLYGLVVDSFDTDDGHIFIIEGQNGVVAGALCDNETRYDTFISSMGVIGVDDITVGGSYVNIYWEGDSSEYIYDGDKIELHDVYNVNLELHREDILSLSDETTVEVWLWRREKRYQLTDGTELMREDIYESDDESVTIVYGYERLISERAEKAIDDFYDERNNDFDLMAELEAALAEVRAGKESRRHVSHRKELASYSDDVIYLLSSYKLPYDSGEHYISDMCDGFDRVTGEHFGIDEIFDCDKETLICAMLDSIRMTDPEKRKQFIDNFEYEYIWVTGEYIYAEYPDGVISESSAIIAADIDDMRPLMHDWAIPKNE